MNENLNIFWVWFSLIDIEYSKKIKLLEVYNDPEIIYNMKIEKLEEIRGIGIETIRKIEKSKNEKLLEYHKKYMETNEIGIISIFDEIYPDNLKKIYRPPIALYFKGNIEILKNKNVSIIGCRECSKYGKNVAKNFAENIALNGINIVSGLARGIDSWAHIGCLEADKNEDKKQTSGKIGKTIAILGNGLDTIYPSENSNLATEIINYGGLLISEYPCGVGVAKKNFPERNRIISGISESLVVVEAKEKSGTLITVDYALEEGKDVFVVPGNIGSINSKGTNKLIKQGARLVDCFEEVLEELV